MRQGHFGDPVFFLKAIARLGKNEDVRVEVLARICLELDCSMDEIIEILP